MFLALKLHYLYLYDYHDYTIDSHFHGVGVTVNLVLVDGTGCVFLGSPCRMVREKRVIMALALSVFRVHTY